MNLIWGIVRKDVRRLAVPVGLWYAIVVAAPLLLCLSQVGEATAIHREVFVTWLHLRSGFALVFMILQCALAYVLAGGVVLEDPVVGTTSFWMTRPISSRRLLAAKLTSAALLFVVAPVVLLIPVWVANSFSSVELWQAAATVASVNGVVTVFAILVASLTRHAGQFFMASVVLAIALGVCASSFSTGASGFQGTADLQHSRGVLVTLVGLVSAPAIISHQFLTRRTVVTWTFIGLTLAMLCLIRASWPWPIWSSETSTSGLPDVAGQAALGPVSRAPGNTFVSITTPVPNTPDRFRAPLRMSGTIAREGTNLGAVEMTRGRQWGREAARQVIGLGTATDSIAWPMDLKLEPGASALGNGTAVRLDGELLLADLHGRVLGEMPVRPGAELRDGSTRVQLAAIRYGEHGEITFVVVEKSAAAWGRAAHPVASIPREHEFDELDVTLLVDRSTGAAAVLSDVRYDSIVLTSGIRLNAAEFQIGPRQRRDWEKDASLVRVRFRRTAILRQRVSSELLRISEEVQP